MEATFEATAQPQSWVGHYYRAEDHYEVGREKIREYARAVQDFHPAHSDEHVAAQLGYAGLIAPTTFLSTTAMLANRRLIETVLTGYDVVVQTDQVFEMHKPVLAGAKLIRDVELESVRTIAGRDLLTVKNSFIDQSGEVVQVMHTTVVGITGDDVDSDLGDAVQRVLMHGIEMSNRAYGAVPPDAAERTAPPPITLSEVARTRVPHSTIRFDEVAVGDELPPRSAHLTRGDLVNYAGVAGDNNPIHWDDTVAALAGLPDVIAHGMLTMGLGAGFVTTWLGDPGALTKYSVRLSNYTLVAASTGGTVEFTGRIKSLDAATKTAVVVIVAKSGGRKIFGLATAEVRLA